MKSRILKSALLLFLVAAVFVMSSVFNVNDLLYKSNNDITSDSENNDFKSAEELLPSVKDAQMLKALLKQSAGGWDKTLHPAAEGAPTDDSLNGERASSDDKDYSKTNTQVLGVDEADIIKTDGKYIYYINNRKLYIVDAKNPAKLSLVTDISFNEIETPMEMFLDGDKMVLISTYYENQAGAYDKPYGPELAKPALWWGGKSFTKVRVYNIQNKSKVSVEKEFAFDGSYNTSRKTGNQVYIVGNKYSYYYPYIYDEDGKVIGERGIEEFIPSYMDSTKGEKWNTVNITDIKYFSNEQSSNFICLVSIDISDSKKAAVFKTYLGDGYQVYASTENLYIIGSVYRNVDVVIAAPEGKPATEPVKDPDPAKDPDRVVYDTKPVPGADEGAYQSGGTDKSSDKSDVVDPVIEGRAVPPLPPEDEKVVPPSPPEDKTEYSEEEKKAREKESNDSSTVFTGPDTVIYKFALNNGDIKCVAEGQAPGSIINQFSMDESNGYFRIATTTYMYDSSWRGNTSNNVYVYDSGLKQVGKLENLAEGENIYSVRFMGDKAYMVTYKTVDPLFVIDLSNPKAPKVLGELKIPGYSSYLHPYDENHIIGFGMVTKEVNENLAITEGMKVAMFDVSDVNNPKELFKFTLGDRGTYSSLLYNHKALLFSKEKGIIGFPVNVFEIKKGEKEVKDPITGDVKYPEREIFEYGQFVYQGFYIYEIDLESGFKLRGRVTHHSEDEFKNTDQYGYNPNYDYMKEIQRGIYIGDTLITVSGKKIVSSDLNTMKLLSEIDIK